jgi:hypothetical protein
MLRALCNAIRWCTVVVVVGLLYMTMREYLLAFFDDHVPLLGQVYLHVYLITTLFAIVIFFATAWIQRGSYNPVTRILRALTMRQSIKTLRVVTYSFVGYSVISTLAAAVVGNSSASFWNPASPETRLVIIFTVVWISLVSLVPLLLLLVRAIPDFGMPSD